MNKEQAAAALGITVRTLQRHMAAHRIGFAMRKTATGEEATFSAEEVARFKAQRDALTETVTPAANVSEVVGAPAQALERQMGAEGMAILVSAIKRRATGLVIARNGSTSPADAGLQCLRIASIARRCRFPSLLKFEAAHVYTASSQVY
jgi:hypothetical protein